MNPRMQINLRVRILPLTDRTVHADALIDSGRTWPALLPDNKHRLLYVLG